MISQDRELSTPFPGRVLACAIMAPATWLTGFVGTYLVGFDKSPTSAIVMAIIIGLAVGNLRGTLEAHKPGIDFYVNKVLRLGTILVGIRLSLFEFVKIGHRRPYSPTSHHYKSLVDNAHMEGKPPHLLPYGDIIEMPAFAASPAPRAYQEEAGQHAPL